MSKLLTTTLVTLIITNTIYATQDIELENAWKSSGDLRVGYIKYDYDNPPSLTSTGRIDSHGIYIVPKVSILTPTYKNFSAKSTIAGVTDFGINNPKYETRNYVFDNKDKESFALLQEFFISYSDNSNSFTIGRQELVTPLVEADDYYILSNSFDAINYINSSVDNFSFHLGYFYQMAGVWDSGANGEEFHSMSESSFVAQEDKDNADDTGIMYGAVEYQNKSHKLKVWDYYISDLYNIFLAEYAFSQTVDNLSYNFGFQFVNYKEVGELASNNYTEIDYSILSAKSDGNFDNGFSFSTGATKYTDGEGQSATLGAWGGFPSFTYGFAHSYFNMGSLQNSFIYKAQLSYNLEKIGLNDTSISYRHTNYDLDATHSNYEEYMRLNGIKISYSSDAGSYFKAIYEDRDLDNAEGAFAIRLIGGYKF